MRKLMFADGTTVDCESFVENAALGRLYLTVVTRSMMDAMILFSDPGTLSELRFGEARVVGYTILAKVGISLRPDGFDIILHKHSEVPNA